MDEDRVRQASRSYIGVLFTAALAVWTASACGRTAAAEQVAPSHWVGIATANDVVYLAEAANPVVDRYDLIQKKWLDALALPAVPTAITVSQSMLLVSDATATTAYTLAGGNPHVLGGALPGALALRVDGYVLYSAAGWTLQSYNLQTSAQINRLDGDYGTPNGFVIDKLHGRLLGNQLDLGPASMVYRNVSASGIFGTGGQSPDFAYPIDTRNYLTPDSSAVINSGGVVWSTTDEAHIASIGGYFSALAFVGGEIVVLRASTLYRVSAGYLELGRYSLDAPADELVADGEGVVAFRIVGGTPQAQRVDLADIGAPLLPPPPDPSAGPYLADQVELGADGILFLLQKSQRAIHRFDLNDWSYLPSIPLPEAVFKIAIDPATGRCYVAYASPRVGVVEVGSGTVTPFTYTLSPLVGLAMAGQHLFVADYGGSAYVQRLLDPVSGAELSSADNGYASQEYVWSPQRSRIYFYTDGIAPDDLHYDSVSGSQIAVGPIATPNFSLTSAIYPIRVDPTGSFIVTGAGQVFDASSLSLLDPITDAPGDIAWIDSRMYDVATGPVSDGSVVHGFSAARLVDAGGKIAGAAQRLLAYAGGLITVMQVHGATVIGKVPAELTGSDLSVSAQASSSAAVAGNLAGIQFEFLNQGPQGPVAASITVDAPAGVATVQWQCETRSASFACGAGPSLQIVNAIDAGDWLRVLGFFTTPVDARDVLRFQASIQPVSGTDLVAENNTSSGIVPLDRVFTGGFE